MSSNNLELRIVKITENLGKGIYASEDVFTQEKITIILSGKLRMNYIKLPKESLIYAEIRYVDNNARGRYIPTFRDPMSDDNNVTPLQKQKNVLDAQFIERFGVDKLTVNGVY